MVKLSSSEEENTEFLSSLWDKYKYLFILIIVTFIAGILGLESWLESQSKNQQKAFDLYGSFIETRKNSDKDSIILANEIIETFPDSLYADLVTLYLAKIQVDQSNFKEAEKYLRLMLEKHSSFLGADFDPIEVTARQRLARVLVSNSKPEEALELINATKSLNNTLFEIKGDIETELGLISEARVSYLKAIESTQNQSIQALIRMKLADLEIED